MLFITLMGHKSSITKQWEGGQVYVIDQHAQCWYREDNEVQLDGQAIINFRNTRLSKVQLQ